MAAEIRGVLQLEGSCIYVTSGGTGERYPILWPAETTWDAENTAVVPPVGAPIPTGGAVLGGGGYMHVSNIDRLAGSAASELAYQCVDNPHDEVAVVNNQDSAIARLP